MQSRTVPKTKEDLVREAKGVAGVVDAAEARELHAAGAIFLDVREPGEWEKGRIAGAKLVPRGLLEFKIATEVPDHDARIVTYCAAGGRAVLAAARLKEMGYAGAVASEPGYQALAEAGLPTDG